MSGAGASGTNYSAGAVGTCVTLPDGRKVPRAATQRCVCTEKQVRLSFVILTSIVGLVVVALVWFFWATRQVREWTEQKQNLKRTVKDASRKTGDIVAQVAANVEAPPGQCVGRTSSRAGNDVAQRIADDETMDMWLESIESVRVGTDGDGFLFVMDTSGGIWAHGKTMHLARGGPKRNPGFHNIMDMDNPRQHTTPAANMIRAAKRGGGFVYFRWKKNVLILCYVHPVKGTDLIVGGGIPVPKSQRVWEESSVRNADYEAGGVLRRGKK